MGFGYFGRFCLKMIIFQYLTFLLFCWLPAKPSFHCRQRAELGWQPAVLPGRACLSPLCSWGFCPPGHQRMAHDHLLNVTRDSGNTLSGPRILPQLSHGTPNHQVFCVPGAPLVLEGFLGFCLYRVVLVCRVGAVSLSQCSVHIPTDRENLSVLSHDEPW